MSYRLLAVVHGDGVGVVGVVGGRSVGIGIVRYGWHFFDNLPRGIYMWRHLTGTGIVMPMDDGQAEIIMPRGVQIQRHFDSP